MRTWTKRDPVKNYFPLPNEIYQLGLSHGAIAVYGYLLRIEDRRTYQCHPSYATIGKAVGMSNNTVRKYVQELEERGLIVTEHYHAGRAQAKRKSALHDPAHPVFHRPVLSAAVGCCGQSNGTTASGKTHGADRCVKQQICFSAFCCCDRKNRGTHRCEERYSNGAARLGGAATPRNSDAHKRIAVPQAFCVLREHPRPRPKSGKVCRFKSRPRRVSEPRKTLRG